jgi:hypothetical protein
MTKENLFILMIIFMIGCSEPIEQEDIPEEFETLQQEHTIIEQEQIITAVKENTQPDKQIIEVTPKPVKKAKAPSITKQPIGKRISQQVIDSLNEYHEVFDSEKFVGTAVTYFDGMATKLNGKSFFAETDEEVMENIMEILTTRMNNGTDLVLLIDKTGSMKDDLEKVRNGLSQIEKFLENFDNVNLAVASYGDSNWHGELWFNASELDNDISKIGSFMDSYTTMGNPDTPESVNEALVRVAGETDWTPGNERLVLVIGDAPSQKPPYSKYTSEQVVEYCDSMDITFNLYPIIIGNTSTFYPTIEQVELDIKAFPNPVSHTLTIDFGITDACTINIYDMNGKLVLTKRSFGPRIQLNVSALESEYYMAQILSDDLKKTGISKFVVRR